MIENIYLDINLELFTNILMNKIERIVEINGNKYRLNKIVDKTATDIHHILWQKYKHIYNVNAEENKVRILRKDHIDYNNFVKDKQNPREALQKMYEMCKQVLTPWVKDVLETVLYKTDDELFYIPEVLKNGKHKRKKREENM